MPATSLSPPTVETKLAKGVPFRLGDLVLCRYSDYPYWPATIDQTHQPGLRGTICCTRPTVGGSLVLCLWCTFCNEDTGGWVRFDRIVRYHPALVDAVRVPKDHFYYGSQTAALSVAERAFNCMPVNVRQIENVPRPPSDFFKPYESSTHDIILPGDSDSNTEVTPERIRHLKPMKKQAARRTFSGCPLSDDEADKDFSMPPRRKIRRRTGEPGFRSHKQRATSASATETEETDTSRIKSRVKERMSLDGTGKTWKRRSSSTHCRPNSDILIETSHITVRQPLRKKRAGKLPDGTVGTERDLTRALQVLREAFCNLGLSEAAAARSRAQLEARARELAAELESLCGEVKRLDAQASDAIADVVDAVAALPERADRKTVQALQAVQFVQAAARMCTGMPGLRSRCESLCRTWTSV